MKRGSTNTVTAAEKRAKMAQQNIDDQHQASDKSYNEGDLRRILENICKELTNTTQNSKNRMSIVKQSIDRATSSIKNKVLPQLEIIMANNSHALEKDKENRSRISALEQQLVEERSAMDKLTKIEKMVLENRETLTTLSKQNGGFNSTTPYKQNGDLNLNTSNKQNGNANETTLYKQNEKVKAVSYAQATAKQARSNTTTLKNSYASILYLKDDKKKTKTSTDALQVARKLVCSKPAGTAIIANKLLSNGKIMIFSKDENSKANLDDLINASDEMISEEPKRQNPVILLKGVPKEIDRDHLPEIIKDCNQDIANACENEDSITVAYLKNNRKEHLVNVAIKVTPTIRRIILETLDRNVSFGFNLVYAEDASPVRQCFHCLSFGHSQTKCPEKQKKEPPQCMHCPGKHLKANCPEKNKKVTCCNCAKRPGTSDKQPENINHSPNSDKCPIYKAVLSKATSKTDYGY
ncbi:uncharacterized protein LOC142644984 [Dermatophagoides pteronyssinus]|uniref:uncharacterized protein LOC142644984 n=1 Tax=Dermatophagoides pteronyssinus TaxID=6956 RepID=UPI003F6724DB